MHTAGDDVIRSQPHMPCGGFAQVDTWTQDPIKCILCPALLVRVYPNTPPKTRCSLLFFVRVRFSATAWRAQLRRWRRSSHFCRYPRPAATASACLRRLLGPQPHALRHATTAGQKCPPPVAPCNVRYAHDSIAAVLFLLLIVTASYAQAPWAPLVSYGLVGKCTQVARSPCCCSASVPTSSRAAQPTLVRSTSPWYTHSTIAPQARPPRSSSVLATHTSMCYMRTTCMCICRSCAERHACSRNMCGAALNCAAQP